MIGEDVTVDESVAGESNVERDDALQSRMSDDDGFFYSQSTGTASSNDGEPQYKPDGGRYGSLDEFRAERKKIAESAPVSQTAKPSVKQEVSAPAANFNKSFRTTDGKLDTNKFLQFVKAQPKTESINPTYKVQQVAEQAPAKAEPVDKYVELDEYEKNLNDQLLVPLRDMAVDIEQGSPAYVKLDKQYRQYSSQIRDMVRTKERELMRAEVDSAKAEVTGREQKARLEQDAKINLGELSQKHFGAAGGVEAATTLLFGSTDDKGTFVRGDAADVVDRLFDRDNGGKQYKSTAEWQAAYNEWWVKTASDKGQLDMILTIARERYIARNYEQYVDAIVEEKVRERIKQQGTTQTARPANVARAAKSVLPGGIPAELASVFSQADRF